MINFLSRRLPRLHTLELRLRGWFYEREFKRVYRFLLKYKFIINEKIYLNTSRDFQEKYK